MRVRALNGSTPDLQYDYSCKTYNYGETEDYVLDVEACPAVADISLSDTGTLCEGESVTLTASEGTSYKWSTGETTPSITVTMSDTYSVEITAANGCKAVDSVKVFFIDCGGETGTTTLMKEQGAYVFPNPATKTINLQINKKGYNHLVLYNLLGQPVIDASFTGLTEREIQLDVSRLSRGTYFLQLLGEQNSKQYKVLLE